jgi:hypothetical protein
VAFTVTQCCERPSAFYNNAYGLIASPEALEGSIGTDRLSAGKG